MTSQPRPSDVEWAKMIASLPEGYELVIPLKRPPYLRRKR